MLTKPPLCHFLNKYGNVPLRVVTCLVDRGRTMDLAAMRATTDLAGALEILRTLPDNARAFMRGMRHVKLAWLAECRDGRRTNRVERMVRIGFRQLARHSMGLAS